MNNALLGMTIQKYICEKYNISMNKKQKVNFNLITIKNMK